jgi:hypothetical protein
MTKKETKDWREATKAIIEFYDNFYRGDKKIVTNRGRFGKTYKYHFR